MLLNIFKTVIIVGLLTINALAMKVGVTAGPHADIMQKIKEKAALEGFEIDVIVFDDFILLNEALNNGDLQANSYQHQPFLDEQIKNKHYKLTAVAKTVLMPIGLYSTTLKSFTELQKGARVLIPNDPSNGGRALLLLQKNGLIKIKENVKMPSILDIIENPKNLQIIELDAAQLPRSLSDASAAVINTDFALIAGINPETALSIEDVNSPYANLLVVQQDKKDSDDVKKLVNIYHSLEIKNYIIDKFKGAVIPVW